LSRVTSIRKSHLIFLTDSVFVLYSDRMKRKKNALPRKQHETAKKTQGDGLRIVFPKEMPGVPAANISAFSMDSDVFYNQEFINWEPIYDLYLADDRLIISIEIAGVRLGETTLRISRTSMLIDGVRRSPAAMEKKHCTYHNLEIPYGYFLRRIDFPVPVQARQCQYRYDNGILIIVIPVVKERIVPVGGD
jgi:HSP20 family molecular chaperone IbpA